METIKKEILGELIAEFKSIENICLIKIYVVNTDTSVNICRKILKTKKAKLIPGRIGLKIFQTCPESEIILSENKYKYIFSIGCDDWAATGHMGMFGELGSGSKIRKGEMIIFFEEIPFFES